MSEEQLNERDPDSDEAAPADPQLEELVAYLDGELASDAAALLEKQLASNQNLRSAADKLDRTWKMLDVMEDAAAGADFTTRTLDSIQILSSASAQTQEITSSSRNPFRNLAPAGLLLWGLAGFLGTTGGILASRLSATTGISDADAALLENLDLLQNYGDMRPLPDLEFLQQLHQIPLNPAQEQPE